MYLHKLGASVWDRQIVCVHSFYTEDGSAQKLQWQKQAKQNAGLCDSKAIECGQNINYFKGKFL